MQHNIEELEQLAIELKIKPSLLVYNLTQNKKILSTGADQKRPIASITKLMTVMLLLDTNPDLSATLEFTQPPTLRYATDSIPTGVYTVGELIKAVLVISDNYATEVLVKNAGLQDSIIELMNARAKQIGMKDTSFVDVSGIAEENVSTANDVQLLLVESMKYDLVQDFCSIEKEVFNGVEYVHTFPSIFYDFRGKVRSIKTGLSDLSFWCVTAAVEHNNNLYAVTILGDSSYQSRSARMTTLLNRFIVDARQ